MPEAAMGRFTGGEAARSGDARIDAKRAKWARFYDMASPSPNLYIIHYKEHEGAESVPMPVSGPMEGDPDKKRLEWFWSNYNRHLENSAWLKDDRVPALNGMYCFTGTEIFAEAFGCKVQRYDRQAPFALPMVSRASEAAKVRKPDLERTSLCKLFEFVDKLRAMSGGVGLVKLPDIQSPMDIVALIWDKNDLYMALYDEPEAVRELASMVKTLMAEFLDAWFTRYGTDFLAHFPDYYMPYGVTLSEDEIGAVGRDHYGEFFLGELNDLSDRYGAMGIHCCAHARHQWGGLREVRNLRLLNLDPGQANLWDAYDFFKDRCAQWHAWYDRGRHLSHDLGWLPGGARFIVDAHAETKDEALRLSERLYAECGN
ncbi:MAG: hypothetical protein FWE70_05060 [Oscillospiraceae bacterium]|nr:hypothetical protein [Oscillospiraceae bacterium]